MKFWDASALVPLLIDEPSTRALQAITARDREILVWWGTQVECVSAVARLERSGALDPSAIDLAFERLRGLIAAWDEVEGTEALREIAQRFLRVHPLRSADALQLAAAFLASGSRPSSLELVTLDQRLAIAAQKEGFDVVEVAVE